MNEERERIRCRNCELVQWSEQRNCRRCGAILPQPVVKVVERVVEKIVIRPDPECLNNLEQARRLLAEASDRLTQPNLDSASNLIPRPSAMPEQFPTIAEMERAMVLAAYQRANRRPLEAARLLGMGKTTFYRKLKEIGKRAA
ncbi:MAG TPA: helix-turn-helix domain-containing protein [Terracidiphilus sp.]|nr:helix-turn-helix domain-containing protein [Terracidiphilus sp.]